MVGLADPGLQIRKSGPAAKLGQQDLDRLRRTGDGLTQQTATAYGLFVNSTIHLGKVVSLTTGLRESLDEKNFIKTGADLTQKDLAAAEWPLARPPYLLETSLPGVFAVGDVRCGNIKRVASAVGEGSIAISFVHRVLAE